MRTTSSYRKVIIYVMLTLSVCIGILTYYADRIITDSASGFTTSDIGFVQPVKAGLLLGTSKSLSDGRGNLYFYYRIEATVSLFKNGKIKYIIVSGDNGSKQYNEPQDMKDELVRRGIPDSVIYLDYAGFRTFDSVIRAKEIFGQDTILIISQEFHNQRAIYLARNNNITAWGFNAKDVSAYMGFKTKLREYFARDKVFMDILFGIKPKFLGDRIGLK
jgi:SanA protein